MVYRTSYVFILSLFICGLTAQVNNDGVKRNVLHDYVSMKMQASEDLSSGKRMDCTGPIEDQLIRAGLFKLKRELILKDALFYADIVMYQLDLSFKNNDWERIGIYIGLLTHFSEDKRSNFYEYLIYLLDRLNRFDIKNTIEYRRFEKNRKAVIFTNKESANIDMIILDFYQLQLDLLNDIEKKKQGRLNLIVSAIYPKKDDTTLIYALNEHEGGELKRLNIDYLLLYMDDPDYLKNRLLDAFIKVGYDDNTYLKDKFSAYFDK